MGPDETDQGALPQPMEETMEAVQAATTAQVLRSTNLFTDLTC